MSLKVILVRITVKPDGLQRFDELVMTNARLSLRDEPGCRRFDVLVAPDDRRRIVLFEIYDDARAFEAHLNSPHYRDFAARAGDVVETSELTSLDFLHPDLVSEASA